MKTKIIIKTLFGFISLAIILNLSGEKIINPAMAQTPEATVRAAEELGFDIRPETKSAAETKKPATGQSNGFFSNLFSDAKYIYTAGYIPFTSNWNDRRAGEKIETALKDKLKSIEIDPARNIKSENRQSFQIIQDLYQIVSADSVFKKNLGKQLRKLAGSGKSAADWLAENMDAISQDRSLLSEYFEKLKQDDQAKEELLRNRIQGALKSQESRGILICQSTFDRCWSECPNFPSNSCVSNCVNRDFRKDRENNCVKPKFPEPPTPIVKQPNEIVPKIFEPPVLLPTPAPKPKTPAVPVPAIPSDGDLLPPGPGIEE